MMKIKLFVVSRDGQDGSFSFNLVNTKEEALKKLNRTEKQLEEGCFYDDGDYQEIELELDKNGKLLNNPYISFE